MKVTAFALLSLITLFVNSPVFALPTSDAASSGVYTPMRWTGSVVEGGPVMELEGTLQVYSTFTSARAGKLKTQELHISDMPEPQNPGWQPPADVLAGLTQPDESLAKRMLPTRTTSSNPSLVERYFKNRPTCNVVPGYLAEGWLIQGRAIPMLEGLSVAGIMCGVAAHSCATCYCEVGSKIELCNDRSTFLNIECRRLAGAAGEIVKDCAEFIAGDYRMRGHWLDTTNYAAIIRRNWDYTCP
ncbi:hypothetical protein TWF281_001326 [Arthrobotrys megalospora]